MKRKQELLKENFDEIIDGSISDDKKKGKFDENELLDCDPISTKRQPYIVTTYNDPDTMNERVLIVVNLPSGSGNVKFSLNENGTKAFVKFSWASAMYDPNILFRKFIESKAITHYHPKILAIKSELEKSRKSINEVPHGVIEITLPFQVQTEISSIEKHGVRTTEDNGQSAILIVELKSNQKMYSLKNSDMSVSFE